MTREPKNEIAVCEFVRTIIEQRTSESLVVTARPDRQERQKQAVEMILSSQTRQYALEHTRIESFPSQIRDGKDFSRLLAPLEREFSGILPGIYWLIVPVGATGTVSACSEDAVRQSVAAWVRANAETLEGEFETEPEMRIDLSTRRFDIDRARSEITDQPPGVPFPVTLKRTGRKGSKLLIMRFTPPHLRELRVQRIREALDRKCAKLAAHHADSRRTVLVLESDDVALANRHEVGEALREVLAARTEVPDLVFLVETEDEPWYGWVLKEDAGVYPDVVDSSLFERVTGAPTAAPPDSQP